MNFLIKALFKPLFKRMDRLEALIEENRVQAARQQIWRYRRAEIAGPPLPLAEVEFKVFSQWGEDGIIQYLLSRVPIGNRVFVEFGVENYREANTRFLLVNDNWRGLVLDSSPANIRYIQRDPIHWQHDLTAGCAFITRENINDLIRGNGVEGDIGLLSIDVDGNDYWIWEAIEVVSPRLVVCEYNGVFGPDRAVVIPYDPGFVRTAAHPSALYYGASLKALCSLAERKGYAFVGSNSAGSNAFFVRADLAGDLALADWRTGYAESRVRESRDPQGRLTYVGGAERLRLIADLPVLDLELGSLRPIRDCLPVG